ncbi:MAG TPA: acyl carrier protein [Ilumatobacteraceae bacterium]
MMLEGEVTAFADELLAMINAEVSFDPSEEITPDTDLLLTGLVDSLGVVQIVAWMEDRLGIEIEPVDVVLENFQTVERMVAFVMRSRT